MVKKQTLAGKSKKISERQHWTQNELIKIKSNQNSEFLLLI